MQQIKSVDEFKSITGGSQTAVIKFYTTWCPDCTRLDQYIDEIVEQHQDKNWYTMDRDEFPEIGESEAVLGIPSLLVYKEGLKIGHLRADRKSQEEIEEFLQRY
ncbi:thioredoxin family protein [Bacillus horti]|uniref:Thiol-disulfide isomerase/thioredoxin n=1 Tax=Caldalkalibacillus horti TaxID=77523 RepID=A0ABT9VT70_9BACI|nr:thioredoxin family protein [Bacillus horti]MDQ0164182.1 thiol-disulfide isomerase/thioredoxin [Bacillus horti]